MAEAIALSRAFGAIKAGEMLAFPATVSERASKQLSASAEELLRTISDVLENLVLSVIEKRTAEEFLSAREAAFPGYADAVLALSSLMQILVPQQAIERLNREFFCELEAKLRDCALSAFGAAVRDQAMFTVWTLRKISDYAAQMAAAKPGNIDQANFVSLSSEFIYHAIRTRFHVHCLTVSMDQDRPLYPEVLGLVIDGLRSVVNTFGLARRLLDMLVPLPASPDEPVVWDDEDEALLREAGFDLVAELD